MFVVKFVSNIYSFLFIDSGNPYSVVRLKEAIKVNL